MVKMYAQYLILLVFTVFYAEILHSQKNTLIAFPFLQTINLVKGSDPLISQNAFNSTSISTDFSIIDSEVYIEIIFETGNESIEKYRENIDFIK